MSNTTSVPSSVEEVLHLAEKAEQSGVPVNWKQLCYQVLTSAQRQVEELQQAHRDACRTAPYETDIVGRGVSE